MKTYTLPDALDYMERLLERFSKSAKASREDLEMQQYVIQIIQYRIRDKENNK